MLAPSWFQVDEYWFSREARHYDLADVSDSDDRSVTHLATLELVDPYIELEHANQFEGRKKMSYESIVSTQPKLNVSESKICFR